MLSLITHDALRDLRCANTKVAVRKIGARVLQLAQRYFRTRKPISRFNYAFCFGRAPVVFLQNYTLKTIGASARNYDWLWKYKVMFLKAFIHSYTSIV